MSGFPVHHCLPEFVQIHVLWVSDAISFSHPLPSSSPLSFSLSKRWGFFPMNWLFAAGGHSMGTSLLVLPMNIQDWFPSNGLVWSPCTPRDSQESSPAPQFESINSLALSLLYGPALTSIHDYWKNHSFEYMDLHWQSDVSAFWLAV